jgi:16S rRNA (adenine(1408)-N(1))-methyltransferase
VIVVHGKQTSHLAEDALEELIARYPGVTVDVGAGDGAFAYRYARAHPERFVIGLDPVRENVREYSARAGRKPERGGAPNVLYVVASVEQVPAALHAVADEIYVTLPWGSLMRGLMLGDPEVLSGIASLGRPGAVVRVVLNTRIFDDPVPIEARDLPEPTPDYVRAELTPLYAACGLRIDEAREFDGDELLALGTTWAKRLSHRRPPPSVYIEATIER